jgi:protein-tyrosine-phosphatase
MSLPTGRWLSFGLPLTLVVVLASPLAHAAEEKELKSKSAKAADSAGVDEVPDGSPKELLAYIKKLQTSQPKGSSRTARMEYVKQVMVNIISASEKIIAAKADDVTTAEAIDAELEAVAVQKRLGDEAAGEKLDKLIEDFGQDKRPAIAQAARFY